MNSFNPSIQLNHINIGHRNGNRFWAHSDSKELDNRCTLLSLTILIFFPLLFNFLRFDSHVKDGCQTLLAEYDLGRIRDSILFSNGSFVDRYIEFKSSAFDQIIYWLPLSYVSQIKDQQYMISPFSI